MITLTKEQKRDLLRRAFGYDPSKHGTKSEFLQRIKADMQSEYDHQISLIETPQTKINRLALEQYLQEEKLTDTNIEL